MADAPVVHIGENSPEHVAYQLMIQVARAEKISVINAPASSANPATRKWILDTYAECWDAATGRRLYQKQP
jgi:hypothetical protein